MDERPATETWTAIETGTAVIARAAIVAVKPRAGADKDSPGEPIRTVVSVRRARVRIIVIVAVETGRRRFNVGWTESEADHDPLRMSVRYRQKSHSQ